MRRTAFLLLMIFSASVLSVNCQTRTDTEKAPDCKFLSFPEAAKILGSRVELVTNSSTFTRDATRFDCHYRVVENSTGEAVNLFFTLEESSDEERAERIYEAIRQSNKNHPGVEPLNGTGDEAYTHSDPPNFHFVMARKGRFTLRLKVNKAAATTSLEALKAFAAKVVEQL